MTLCWTRRVEHSLYLTKVDNIREHTISIFLLLGGIKQLEACRHDDGSHFYIDDVLMIIIVDCLSLADHLAFSTANCVHSKTVLHV